jgi:phage shock protein PspC (stress-responsive transcriptional regulator)
MLAGVAGGMVRYLNADVTLVRVIIAALVLFTGAGVALYVAAWLLIPEDGVDRRPPGPHPLTRTMTRTGTEKGRSAPAASGWPAVGTVTAYAAAIVAFASALMSLYWALGGHALVSTIGGYVEQFARRGGALPVLIALAATLAKLAGGLLALALVRPWGTDGSARVAAGRFSRGQRPARGVRRFDRAAWRARPLGRHPPVGKRGPDGVALARRGLGPVVLGMGDLAGAGYRRLLAPDGNTSSA